jgi:hypothetical protein
MRRQYASKLNVTTRVTTIAVTAITAKRRKRGRAMPFFFQYFFYSHIFIDVMNPLLASDRQCPGGFHLIAIYC